MTASAFVVSFDPETMARSLRNGVGAAVVYANSSADAIAMCQALFGGDIDGDWANATVTAMAAAADFTGWTIRARVTAPDNSVTADVSYVGVMSDTLDLMAAGIVTALNGTTIQHASYNAGTNVLSVTGTADNMGDHKISVQLFPPAASSSDNTGVLVKQGVAVRGFVGTITDGGVSGAACTAALAADSYTVPKVTGRFKFSG